VPDSGRHIVYSPPRVFLYTIDQISSMLNVEEPEVRAKYLYYVGSDIGVPAKHKMLAINIAPEGGEAEWRVQDSSFIKWMRRNGFVNYDWRP
jgi:hypothetical protein